MLLRLKKIRKEQKLTLKKLSQKTNISVTYLSDLENLNRNNPSYKVMNKLTKALKVSMEELEGTLCNIESKK